MQLKRLKKTWRIKYLPKSDESQIRIQEYSFLNAHIENSQDQRTEN